MRTAFDFPFSRVKCGLQTPLRAHLQSCWSAHGGKLCATDVTRHNVQSNVFMKAVHGTQERGVEKSVHVF